MSFSQHSAAINRRTLVTGIAATGGAVLFGFHFPSVAQVSKGGTDAIASEVMRGHFVANAFVRIAKDGAVTIVVGRSEMGQGVLTSLPQIVAEELDADWKKVQFEQSPADPAYVRLGINMMITGGSWSVRTGWQQMRTAGATARAMLIAEAANRWGVSPDTLSTNNGFVLDGRGGQFSYGELAESASKLPVPTNVKLKDPAHFKLIGKSLDRLDVKSKTNGTAQFGMDVHLPGLKVAVVARPPAFGSKVMSFSSDSARRAKGVMAVFEVSGGVAVVADTFWHAKKARDLLVIEWSQSPLSTETNAMLSAGFTAATSNQTGITAQKDGDPILLSRSKTVEAQFELPYLAHACMEPMNCTAWVKPDGVELWLGTQAQGFVQAEAARIAGCKAEQVKVNTMLLGGGFGRRSARDFASLATEISKAIKGPVKLIYTREDDMKAGHYRPYSSTRIRLTSSAKKSLGTLEADASSSSTLQALGFLKSFREDGLDNIAVEGLVKSHYKLDATRIGWHRHEPAVPVWVWRGVGFTHNSVALECAVDELAHELGRDPIEMRLESLDGNTRLKQVLSRAATIANWGTPASTGRARGVAVCQCFGAWVAQVVEVGLVDGQPRVHRVVCVADVGQVIDPRNAKAQIESGIVYGLSAALYGEISIDNGRVVQSNFHDYPVLRMHETPKVDIELVPSQETPGGVGEIGTPAVMAAAMNAMFKLTGTRVRSLPLSKQVWSLKA